ncbi:hypothetical protein [Neptuniibacter sp. QD37_11]|uniref:secretion/conjugation apparatus DotM-related subunit n=1 Tax=Neptuniibacter sp. QD37_11 TaxID=3398209 RepID=UPI0039F4984D
MRAGTQQAGEDRFLPYFILSLIIIGGLYLFFKYNFEYIAGPWKTLRLFELYLVAWIPDWVPLYGKLEIEQAIDTLQNMKATEVQPFFITEIDNYFKNYFSWPLGIILIVYGMRHIKRNFEVKNNYDLNQYLSRVAPFFPAVEMFTDVHPEQKKSRFKVNDEDSALFALAVSPEDWAQRVPPIGMENTKARTSVWDGKDDFDEDLARRAFERQIGPPFRGLEYLSKEERFAYDLYASKVAFSEEEFIPLLQKVYKRFLTGKTKPEPKWDDVLKRIFKQINSVEGEALKKGKKFRNKADVDPLHLEELVMGALDNEKYSKTFNALTAEMVMMRHGFVRTGIMSLLEEARKGGTVPSCKVRNDLKGKDRVLWYCISSTGRNTPFSECAGVFAHWCIERQVGQPITHPEVTEAVKALRLYLKIPTAEA